MPSSQNLLKPLIRIPKSHLTSPFSTISKPQNPLKTLTNPPPQTAATTITTSDTVSLLSNVTSRKLNLMLSDPHVKTSSCFLVFNFIKKQQSHLSYQPDLNAHFTLICRLIREMKFRDAEMMVESVVVGGRLRYPFGSLANWVGKLCKESSVVVKLMNLVLRAYSDGGMFGVVLEVFEYMRRNGVRVCERTCTGHLCALVENGDVGGAVEFLRRMVASDMEVSVFSLTVVVKGLCGIGMTKKGVKLVEEMISKGIVKPNIVTCNTLVDACTKRWNFEVLELVLRLMRKEAVKFNDSTFKFLIDGYSTFGKVEEGESMLLEMQDKGFKMNAFLYVTVIRGYFRLGNFQGGMLLFYRMRERGFGAIGDVYSILINDLCRLGKRKIAEQLVAEMQKKGIVDEVLYIVLKTVYQKSGMPNIVVELQEIVMTDGEDELSVPAELADSELKKQFGS